MLIGVKFGNRQSSKGKIIKVNVYLEVYIVKLENIFVQIEVLLYKLKSCNFDKNEYEFPTIVSECWKHYDCLQDEGLNPILLRSYDVYCSDIL